MIEKGSDTTQLRQVRGGRHDGAWGELVGTVVMPDGDERVTVKLDDGQVITFTEKASAGPDDLPRVRGS